MLSQSTEQRAATAYMRGWCEGVSMANAVAWIEALVALDNARVEMAQVSTLIPANVDNVKKKPKRGKR